VEAVATMKYTAAHKVGRIITKTRINCSTHFCVDLKRTASQSHYLQC
jgi:hypothetical protein